LIVVAFFVATKPKKEGNGNFASCCLFHCNKMKTKEGNNNFAASCRLLRCNKTENKKVPTIKAAIAFFVATKEKTKGNNNKIVVTFFIVTKEKTRR